MDRAMAAWVFGMSIAIALAVFWKSRRHVLFWIGAVLLVVVHVTLLVRLPRSTWALDKGPFKLMGLLDIAGNLAVMGLIQMAIKLLERVTGAPNDEMTPV